MGQGSVGLRVRCGASTRFFFVCAVSSILLFCSYCLLYRHHLSGTCSMLPRDGGVVSPELVVYGTANLRVIDMSISPLLPATHTQSTACE